MNPKVSVCCPTYGHEPYIQKALESILMQKVDFEYEVLIGEDCSPDNSRSILKKYEVKYPNIFKIIYRDKNVGGAANVRELYSMARGKYVCTLELDDFWLNPNKLQIQADFLDAHPEAIAVSMRCIMVGHDGEILKKEYPQCQDYRYTYRHFRGGILPTQTAGLMYRNIYDGHIEFKRFDASVKGPGDRRKIFSMLCSGAIYCLPEIGSGYRFVTKGGTSYSARCPSVNWKDYYSEMVDYARQVTKKKAILTAEVLYAKYLVLGMLKNHSGNDFKRFFKQFASIQNKLKCILILIPLMTCFFAKKATSQDLCHKDLDDKTYRKLIEVYGNQTI